jgi:hypothetical protein
MYKDIDGDAWIFAPIDPPEHYYPESQDPSEMIFWLNYLTQGMWTVHDGKHHKWSDREKAGLCITEKRIGREMKDITGYTGCEEIG